MLRLSFPPLQGSFITLVVVCAAGSTWVLLVGEANLLLIPIVLGTFASIFGFYMLIRDWRSLRLGNLLSTMLLGAYFGGYLVLLVSKVSIGSSLLPQWYLDTYGQVDPRWIVSAGALVGWSALASAVIALFERPLLSFRPPADKQQVNNLIILIIALVVLMLTYVRGETGFMGIQNSPGGGVPPLASIARTIIVASALMAFYQARLEINRKRRFLYFILFTIFEILIIPIGRRPFLYSVILVAVIWGATSKSVTIRSWRFFRILLILLLVTVVAMTGFFSLRLAPAAQGGEDAELTTLSRVEIGLSSLRTDPTQVVRKLAKNVGPRTGSLLPYLGMYMRNQQRTSQLGGQVAAYSIQLAIPSALWPGKTAFITEYGDASEVTIHSHLGMPIFDGPNTLVTEGYADFGWLGAIGYPVAMLVLFGSYLSVLRRLLSGQLQIFLMLIVLSSIVAVESTLTGYLVVFRDLSLITGVMVAATFLASIFRGALGSPKHLRVAPEMSANQHPRGE